MLLALAFSALTTHSLRGGAPVFLLMNTFMGEGRRGGGRFRISPPRVRKGTDEQITVGPRTTRLHSGRKCNDR